MLLEEEEEVVEVVERGFLARAVVMAVAEEEAVALLVLDDSRERERWEDEDGGLTSRCDFCFFGVWLRAGELAPDSRGRFEVVGVEVEGVRDEREEDEDKAPLMGTLWMSLAFGVEVEVEEEEGTEERGVEAVLGVGAGGMALGSSTLGGAGPAGMTIDKSSELETTFRFALFGSVPSTFGALGDASFAPPMGSRGSGGFVVFVALGTDGPEEENGVAASEATIGERGRAMFCAVSRDGFFVKPALPPPETGRDGVLPVATAADVEARPEPPTGFLTFAAAVVVGEATEGGTDPA